MARLDNLKADLTAIDHLDQFYWRIEKPDRYEKLGYQVRKDWRRVLITELLKLMQAAANSKESVSRSDESSCDAAERSDFAKE